MKKIYITFFFCLQLSLVVAQDNATIQETQQDPNWPVLLSNLNTAQITSGILIDKITTFANLINYNTTEKNASNSKHFNQALSELYRASDQTRLISLTELTNRTANTTSENTVDVGIINTTFHKLNFNEENPAAGGLTFNQSTGKLSSIAGQQSYINKKITMVSPLKEFITGSSFQFNFKNTLILNNETTTIKTLVVDFEDGNVAATIISNSAIVTPNKLVNYSASGMKTLTFTITFSDNTTLITYGKIYVNYNSIAQRSSASTTNSACYELLKDKGEFTSTIPFQGYAETSAVYGKTEYTIFYGNSNNAKQMVKPIIIVDGFDPKDKRKVQDCDCAQDPVCVLNNDDDDNGIFDPAKHESLEDLMNYNEVIAGNNVQKNLIQELRSKGYDVIIINNPTYTTTNVAGQTVTIDGGADYIERNAMTLVSYMQSVKGQQAIAGSTEKLVLLGPSMGGQITRYALAYMEKKFAETNDPKWQHNARLWVSVDSPHLGANIPVGAQANIWFMADKLGKEPAKIQYYEELNSVAGKQQIISQFKNAKETGYLGGNSFFTTYYNNLNTNGVAGSGGYPVSNSSFRKIAMANGSLTGTKDATEQQTFLYMRGYIRGFWPFQNSTITLLRLQDNFMPAYGQTNTVFKGDGQNSTFNIGFNHWYIDFSHPRYTLNVNNNSIKGSLDVVPGGYFKTAKLIQEAVSDGISDAGIRQETRDYIENHSFISTFSALGHLNPNQNWGNPLNTNLTCPSNKLTPFDSYYGTANNTEHTSFTKESIDWLFKELDGIPQAPYFPIDENSLTGPDSICSTTTFSFSDICKIPSTATWSVSPNLQIISSTGYSVTVNQIWNTQGSITATFQNGQTLTKILQAPDITMLTAEEDDICFQNANYDGMVIYGATSGVHFSNFSSSIPSQDNLIYYMPNGLSADGLGRKYLINVPSTLFGEQIFYNITYTNQCGQQITRPGDFPIVAYECSNFRTATNSTTFTIYPNPATTTINVALLDETNAPAKKAVITGKLYDLNNIEKRKVTIKDNNVQIDASGLNRGVYILKIDMDGKSESHQVIVK
ncbi:T9SS type A sorting domain-containing protein [Flavobacterium sp. HJJ]|uniref:T9SS type A sorting domain-containing protein n=1 Tax=Flavobacterium sp. HJJ TaxID=2783792 RepID=UPI00188A78C1|nr:T9SS type A sorting domain-containing protein [Flavobacterium sp. HJJ]MBF4471267.1 T9SS type A sorting domain-containing protein [Flavobacterium sp. HJJ]